MWSKKISLRFGRANISFFFFAADTDLNLKLKHGTNSEVKTSPLNKALNKVPKVIHCLRYCFLLTKNCVHNKVWGYMEILYHARFRRNTYSFVKTIEYENILEHKRTTIQ